MAITRDAPAADEPGPRKGRLLLVALLVWSFALRLWFATPGLDKERFYDEGYGLDNVESLLTGGGLRPANGYHPSLSYLPQAGLLWASAALHRATGIEALAVLAERRGRFTPTAYLLCRGSQVIFGCAGLLALYAVGRRLGGRALGLAAAFLLAVVPWHIRQSAIYKPDILLLLTVTVAFLLSLEAVSRPSLRTYAVAGVAIGLALASKFNAGPVAVPLAVGTLLVWRRHRRALLWLAVAGAVSLAVFLALDPYVLLEPSIYQGSFAETLQDYATKGEERGGDSRLYLYAHLVRSLVSGMFHGPLVGALGLVGLVAVTWAAARRWRAGRRGAVELGWLMASSYVVAYVVLYSLTTTNPSPHNWLPLSPFVALAAGRALLAAWGRLEARVGEPARRALPAVVAVVVLALAWPANAFVYVGVVPSTKETLARVADDALRDVDGRVVVAEGDLRLPDDVPRRSWPAIVVVDRLDAATGESLDAADAELFPAARLEAPGEVGAFYRRRLAAGVVHTAEPAPFRARGEAVVLVLHPHELIAEPVVASWVPTAGSSTLYRLDRAGSDGVPGGRSVRAVSFAFRHDGPPLVAELLADGEPVPFHVYRGPGKKLRYTTPRIDPPRRVRLRVDRPLDGSVAVWVRAWRAGDGGDP